MKHVVPLPAFRHLLAALALLAAILTGSSAHAASAHSWEGSWKTQHGELRLIQQGNRVYGDYSRRGYIEGVVSADGKRLRGTFQYVSDRAKAGTIEFVMTDSERFRGRWEWKQDEFADAGLRANWSGTRTSRSRPTLVSAGGNGSFFADYVPGAGAAMRAWLYDGVEVANGPTRLDPAIVERPVYKPGILPGVDPVPGNASDFDYTALRGDEWLGTFTTNHGQLRLVQDGRRVYGEYSNRGLIEGCLFDGGRTFRGTFQYFSPRRRHGFVEFRQDGDGFEGTWTWTRSGPPAPEAAINWRGARSLPDVPEEVYRRGGTMNFADAWPELAPETRRWVLGSDYYDSCDPPEVDYGEDEQAFPGEML